MLGYFFSNCQNGFNWKCFNSCLHFTWFPYIPDLIWFCLTRFYWSLPCLGKQMLGSVSWHCLASQSGRDQAKGYYRFSNRGKKLSLLCKMLIAVVQKLTRDWVLVFPGIVQTRQDNRRVWVVFLTCWPDSLLTFNWKEVTQGFGAWKGTRSMPVVCLCVCVFFPVSFYTIILADWRDLQMHLSTWHAGKINGILSFCKWLHWRRQIYSM